MYKTVEGIGYQRHPLGLGDKQESLQEWFMNQVFEPNFKVANWAAKVKEMTNNIDSRKSTGDLGFSGRYGYDGPGKKPDIEGIRQRGPFLYSVKQLGEKEIGRNPFTEEVRQSITEQEKRKGKAFRWELPSKTVTGLRSEDFAK